MFQQWFKQKKYLTLASALLLLLIIFMLLPAKKEYLLYTVKRGDLKISIPVEGELEAVESFVVRAPVNAWGNIRIVKIVPEGTLVKKGDFLIQFDTSEQEQRLHEAQNKLETAMANLASTKADIQNEMAELENSIKLEKYSLEQAQLQAKNSIYEAENKRKEIELNLKKAELNYQQLLKKRENLKKIHKARLRQAELEVEQAKLQVNQAQKELQEMTLYAPAEGMVVYKKVWGTNGLTKLKVGYTPWRSQPLLDITSKSKMKVMAKIDENEISRIEKGLPVEIRLDAVKDTLFTGKITDISTLAHQDNATEKNVFDIEILIDQMDARLKPGMTAHCKILINIIKDVLLIPMDAVQVIEGQSYVFDSDGDQIRIEVGESDGDLVMVKSGLEEGDQIRLKSVTTITQGSNESSKKKPKKRTNRLIYFRLN